MSRLAGTPLCGPMFMNGQECAMRGTDPFWNLAAGLEYFNAEAQRRKDAKRILTLPVRIAKA
jgi:hypothetical protein